MSIVRTTTGVKGLRRICCLMVIGYMYIREMVLHISINQDLLGETAFSKAVLRRESRIACIITPF